MDNAQRIISVSRKLRLICTGLIVGLPLLYAVFWIFFNEIRPHAPMVILPVRVDREISDFCRLLGFLVDMIPLAAAIYGLLKLRDLFQLYGNGLIFTEENVNCLRSLGRTLLVWVACDILRYALLSIVLTLGSPPGKGLLVVGINSGDLTGVFVGIVVLIISWVMDEARKLEEEQALII